MSQFAVIHSSGARARKAVVALCVVFEFKWQFLCRLACWHNVKREQKFRATLDVDPKLLENSKLALVSCSDELRGWVSSNSPDSESCTSTSPFFH